MMTTIVTKSKEKAMTMDQKVSKAKKSLKRAEAVWKRAYTRHAKAKAKETKLLRLKEAANEACWDAEEAYGMALQARRSMKLGLLKVVTSLIKDNKEKVK